MKKSFFSSIVKVLGLLVMIVFFVLVINKDILVPSSPNEPLNFDDVYPPPVSSPAPTDTAIPYPPPDNTSAATLTPAVIIFTTEATLPPPPEWPTNIPWPPPRQTQVFPTGLPTIFPTPVFPPVPDGRVPVELQELWYAYEPDSNTSPLVQMEQIDLSAQRWGKGSMIIDIGLEPRFPGPTLRGLFPSPDQKWIIAAKAYGEGSSLDLINLESGKVAWIHPFEAQFGFMSWTPDSKNIIVYDEVRSIWLINIYDGNYHAIEFPSVDSIIPTVDGIAFSPDGNFRADALYYPATHKVKEESLMRVEITDVKKQERKTISENSSAWGISRYSLKWSTDGRFLTWITIMPVFKSDSLFSKQRSDLWIYDKMNGEVKLLLSLGEIVSNIAPPSFAPDNKKLAVIRYNESDKSYSTGNIFLIELISRAERQASYFSERYVTNLEWSSDSKTILFTLSDEINGEICALNIESGSVVTVAGPVLAFSPFALVR